jgi:alginate O-acetyltransferase complex protein AlgI
VIFLSYWFIVFALILLPVYFVMPWARARLVLLALGCVIFHGHFAGPSGVIPIIILSLITYFCAISRRRELCVAGIVICVLALLFYKDTRFIGESIASAWPAAGALVLSTAEPLLPALPPLAVSFFVFEFVHYLYEVRKGGPPIYNPLHFGLFAIFWPSLVAGPIKRYQVFVPSLLKGVSCVSGSDVVLGLLRVTGGMLKKALADNLTLWIDFQSTRFETLDLHWRWIFLLMLALRIYLDFSGYSDMAIGYARMMGIHLPENFNWPYIARSIDEFWSRWHISLSSWIRDYIYIPLGGNRRGPSRRILNGLIAFAICGLWHGAAWNFAIWGLYHGAGLAIRGNYVRLLGPVGRPIAGVFARLPLLSAALTFFFVASGWLLFFYPVSVAVHMFVLLFRT